MIVSQGKSWAKMFFPSDTDKASVLVSCSSLAEARSYKNQFGKMCAIYQYDIKNKELVNETFIEVL